MESRMITPGPYRATKLWNELTKLFRAGMPLKKHRMHLKKYTNCFMASEAVDWLHELLRSNSNFGPEVTRQQTLQLLRKFLKNHVIEDMKGRWGAENLDDNSQLYRFPTTSPLKVVPNHPPFHKTNAASRSTKVKGGFCELPKTMTKENDILQFQVNAEETDKEMPEVISEEPKIHVRQVTQTDIEETWREVALNHLQKILGLAALNDVLDFSQVIPQYILYNVHNVSKHGVVILQDKSEDLPHWVLSAMKCLANWPRNNDLTQPSYPGFERDVFKTVADYFVNLPEPLLTFEFYELFVNILGLLQPQLERIAIEALQICCLFLPPPNRRKLQLLMRMISRISQNVDMPQLHEAMGTRMLVVQTFSRGILRCENEADLDELLGTRLVSFILDHHQEILQVPPYLQNAVDNHIRHLQKVQITYPCTNMNAEVPMYTFCKQISTKEFEEQKVSVSQIAIAELLENIVEDKKISIKDKRKKLKQFQREYPEIYQNRFPTTDSEAKLFQDKPKIKQPMLITMKRPLKSLQKMQRLRY
ncbi:DEP domain-containing protein 1A-like isoform X2 [Hemiscyllium ocellatum]|uniref:DEP domain-containing protein 1A-like isoform X2 n=1 Tax=Hemiscyllium ocellatum TaxID=170820 RepID=UPI002966F6C6|nr:DEP domain-containing protein 1A-like isoform X2 [Hemiscyllium ocellatum]